MAGPSSSVIDEKFLFSDRLLSCLESPGSGGTLELIEGGFRDQKTQTVYPHIDGIPSLYIPNEGEGEAVTNRVKSFYEENPFPSYEGLEEFGELVTKGHSNSFSKGLLKAIGYNKLVLECGCGTGQLSHYLQLNNNHVLGIDMSLGSLRLALEHKHRNALNRGSFAQMNIFNLAIKDGSFDVVISHGVLHHTYDAKKAFGHIARKVKPGGFVVVGLYNRYARVATWLRSKVINITKGKIDYVVRNRIRDPRKAKIWIKDQYFNPHETWHSIGEVLGWFDDFGLQFVNCSPAVLGSDGEIVESFFDDTSPGTPYQRVATQLSWLGTIAREGALFDIIARRKE